MQTEIDTILKEFQELFDTELAMENSRTKGLSWHITSIKLKSFLRSSLTRVVEEVINELESNPHPGTEFKNLQYWIEAKQLQLRNKYGITK